MSTTPNRLAGLAASLLILLLVVGTPALLIAIGATPWHQDVRGLGTLLTSPDDGTLAMLVIGVVAWCAWAVMAVSFAVEILAALRGVPAPRLPGLGVPQGMAGRLVAVAALLFAVAPTAVPVFTPPPSHASPPPDVPQLVNLPEARPQAPVEPTEAPASTADHATPTVEYTVRRGDSLWKIAEEHLGDGMRFREIVALNEDVLHGQPNFIDPGLVLRLPGDGESADEQSEEPSAGEKYVVEPGDTLWGIAEDEIGDGERYPEIFDASRNTVQADGERLTDPDLIRPGWEVTIPASANGSPVGDPPTVDDSPEAPSAGKPRKPDPTDVTPPAQSPEPPTAIAEPDESSVTSQTDTSDDEKGSMSWLLPGLMGAGALLAGSLLVTIRAHRRTQQRSRRPGRTIAPPPAELRAIEKTAFIAGGPTADAITQLDRLLRHLATATDERPKLHTVEVGNESVTLHLAEPAELPGPWSGSENSWSADLAAPVGDEDVLPPYPLLASLGRSEDGHLWLIDLEQLGVVALAGDTERATSVARHLAAELALSPWAVIVHVDTLDVGPELAALDDHRLQVHTDDADFIDALQQDLTRALNDGHGDPEPYRAVIASGDQSDQVRAVAELVQHQTSRSGCAVISAGEPVPGDAVFEVGADARLRVPDLDLDLTAAGLSIDEAAATAAIVDLTRETTVAPMPREQGATGWRALADHAGALVSEMTQPRPPGEAGDASLLPEATQRYEATAPTTAEDIDSLAPVVSEEASRFVEETDPQLDDDLAEWRDPASELPKVQLLGPVTVIAPDEPPTAVAERRAYFTELVAFLALHPSGVSSRQVRDAFGMTQSRARTDLGYIRSWFGTNPRTGELHLPPATTSPAHKDRGASGYQLNDVLVDLDLFRRLHARAQARGAEGMTDLVAALDLVTGEPFSALRNSGWSWLLDDERVHDTAAFAVVDVAHIVATDAFSRGDLERAKFAAETGCMAAPYDEVCRLDLAKVAQAEGHNALAEQILDEHVFNRTDDQMPPVDPSSRTNSIVGNGWGGQRGAR